MFDKLFISEKKYFLLIIIISTLFISCSKSKIKDTYLDINNKLIYEFKDSELFIYNLNDSIKKEYSIEWDENKINLKSNNKSFTLNYLIEKNILWLFDSNHEFIYGPEIKLLKVKFDNSLDSKYLYFNYWATLSEDKKTSFWIKFKENYANLYEKENSKSIYFDHSFDFEKKLYFEKFIVYKFKSYLLEPYNYLLIKSNRDSLNFIQLDSFKELNFSNHTSIVDRNLIGTWSNLNFNDNLTIFNDDGPFYFGDTISFTNNNEFIKKIGKNKSLSISYEIGLDTKFIFFDNPLDKILEIEKLSNDTLIFRNQSFGKEYKMRYIRIDN
ncbi:MAG: hypothetical protein CVU08_08765 [Bacteroidetes bacterium HGW-Bacteroidetes-3]|nr:MAG: hypothetical protein CVU08_08765 [Bacteroidetes bacterium HGW-Bacteroidetes-3]